MNGGKRLFLALSFVSLAILGSGVILLFWLVMPRLQMLAEWLFYTAAAAAALFLLVVSGGLFLLFLSAITERDFLFPHGKKQVTVKVLYPINLFLGFLLGIGRERVGESFVEFNNALVRATRKRIDIAAALPAADRLSASGDIGYRELPEMREMPHLRAGRVFRKDQRQDRSGHRRDPGPAADRGDQADPDPGGSLRAGSGLGNTRRLSHSDLRDIEPASPRPLQQHHSGPGEGK